MRDEGGMGGEWEGMQWGVSVRCEGRLLQCTGTWSGSGRASAASHPAVGIIFTASTLKQNAVVNTAHVSIHRR